MRTDGAPDRRTCIELLLTWQTKVRRPSTSLAALAGTALIGMALLVVMASRPLEASAQPVSKPEAAPVRPLVLVLGAPPGPLLDARMDTACALVRLKKAEKVIVSGLPLEIPTMAARARTCVGEEDLLVDDGAQRTFDSLVRARDRFGARSLLVVTQAFHMDRALYLARALGLEADGVLAGGPPPGLRTRLRERAARVRARVDVALLSMR